MSIFLKKRLDGLGFTIYYYLQMSLQRGVEGSRLGCGQTPLYFVVSSDNVGVGICSLKSAIRNRQSVN